MVQISKGCLNEGIRRGSGVERLSSGSESHSRIPMWYGFAPHTEIFSVCRCVNLPICMWSGCCRADPVVSQAYPGMPRYVLAFLHLKAALSVILRNEGVAVCKA